MKNPESGSGQQNGETKTTLPKVKDAAPKNWADRFLPGAVLPFARLARWDRPIGFWLLFWPCAHSIALSMVAKTHKFTGFDWQSLVLLFIGAVAMRGAGCTFNDITDRDIDKKVERTALRPIPAGDATIKAAWVFLALQCFVGLLVVVQFNGFTQILAVSSLILVAIYPFMKRVTYWPQLFLGLSFGWGALVGWAITFGTLHWPAVILYLGSISWIIGYDTLYALQDKEDDALIGVKSTALLFGERVRTAVAFFYIATLLLWGWAGLEAGGGVYYLFGLAVVALSLTAQIFLIKPNDGARALKLFKFNHWVGFIFFLALYFEFKI